MISAAYEGVNFVEQILLSPFDSFLATFGWYGETITVASVNSLDADYKTNGFYDEMLAASGQPRPGYRRLYDQLQKLGPRELARRHDLAMQMFRNHGITFAVYPDAQGTEKVFPFDIIPRVISAQTWRRLEAGLKQRMAALNLFLDDVYGRKLILKQRVVPPEIVLTSPQYLREVEGLPVPHGIHCHIAGVDLVRDQKGKFFVLEDNLRTPSGVSYVLANRHVMKRVLPDLFAGYPVRPVEGSLMAVRAIVSCPRLALGAVA